MPGKVECHFSLRGASASRNAVTLDEFTQAIITLDILPYNIAPSSAVKATAHVKPTASF
jgi:hypothetical protein